MEGSTTMVTTAPEPSTGQAAQGGQEPAGQRISVIIPAYNARGFIDATLASVAAQIRPADEVIVIDDASSDGTADHVRRWDALLPLTVLALEDNGGQGRARRLGIERATGDLIALLDADDIWLPDHLAVLLDQRARAGGIVTAANLRWQPGERLGRRSSPELIPIPPPDEQPSVILYRNFLFSGSLFAREAYERVGGFRPLRGNEDWDLWIRMILAGERVSAPTTPTTLYRMHASSASFDDALLEPDLVFLEALADELDDEHRRVLERSIRRKRARRELLTGMDRIRRGDVPAGRRHLLRAVLLDVRQPRPLAGSVVPRALAALAAPRRSVAYRDRRIADPDFDAGAGRLDLTRPFR